MKSKLFIIGMFIVSLVIIPACQNDDDYIDTDISLEDDNKKVKIGLAFNQLAFDVQTGYEPMSRAQSGYIKMPNKFNYIILQKMDNDVYIVERSAIGLIDPAMDDDADLQLSSGNNTFKSLNIEIRPGKYELVAFTGGASFNSAITEGLVIQPQEKIQAVAYSIGGNGYVNFNHRYLKREVFYARTEFEVIKDDKLQETVTTQQLTLNMERRVAKMRIVLLDNRDPNLSFSQLGGQESGPVAMECYRDDDANFAEGLDIWGNLYYTDELHPTLGNSHVDHHFSGFCNNIAPYMYDGGEYLLPQDFTREMSVYMFTDPHEEITITTYDIYANRNPSVQAVYMDNPKTFTIKNNNIYGMVLELTGDRSQGQNQLLLYMQEVQVNGAPMDPVTFIPANYEYP